MHTGFALAAALLLGLSASAQAAPDTDEQAQVEQPDRTLTRTVTRPFASVTYHYIDGYEDGAIDVDRPRQLALDLNLPVSDYLRIQLGATRLKRRFEFTTVTTNVSGADYAVVENRLDDELDYYEGGVRIDLLGRNWSTPFIGWGRTRYQGDGELRQRFTFFSFSSPTPLGSAQVETDLESYSDYSTRWSAGYSQLVGERGEFTLAYDFNDLGDSLNRLVSLEAYVHVTDHLAAGVVATHFIDFETEGLGVSLAWLL